MNKLKYLTKVSLDKKIKTKWFAVVNVLIVFLIVGLINVDTIISSLGGDFSKPTNIVIKANATDIYEVFKNNFNATQKYLKNTQKVEIGETSKEKEELIVEVKDSKDIAIIIENDENNFIKAEIISNAFIDTILYQVIISSLNTSKITLAMIKSNIDPHELALINAPIEVHRNILDESKSEQEENLSFFMGIIFPLFILPFFMFIVFLVQMIGGEINEEKTTRSMEIIISNVSPKIHFISKILASNIFIFLQAFIMAIAGGVGLIIRKYTATNSFNLGDELDFSLLWEQFVSSGIAQRLIYIIPITILLIILSFLAYSLIAGILASMTTSIEDFQQVQTPIILICLSGYYLAMLAPAFEGSLLIKIVSYLPFISALISPPLLLVGQIGITDVFISLALLIITIYLLLKYGMKIYKVGILNYSTSKLWRRMFEAVRG